jgi:alpha 1,3-glucosidase
LLRGADLYLIRINMLRHAPIILPVAFFFVITILIPIIEALKVREDFKKCDQSGFCVRQRAFAKLADKSPGYKSSYVLDINSAAFSKDKTSFSAVVIEESASTLYQLELQFLKGDTIRLKFYQKDPLRKPFEVPPGFALVEKLPQLGPADAYNITISSDHITFLSKDSRVVISVRPFKVDVFTSKDAQVPDITFNKRGYLHYERQRKRGDKVPEVWATAWSKLSSKSKGRQRDEELEKLKRELTKGQWEEEFGGKVDSKPYGK